MHALASYIMKGRMQALLLITLFAVGSLLLAPLGNLSGAIAALVTLRKGMAEGAILMLAATVTSGVLSWLTVHNVMAAVVFLFLVWLPTGILAEVLRRTISMSMTLMAGAVIGVIGIVAIHLVLGDAPAFWQQLLDGIKGVIQEAGMDPKALSWDELTAQIAPLMTGLLVAALLINSLTSLLIGRWWQALLYNPGGFGKEFIALNLGRVMAMGTALVVILSMMLSGTPKLVATDIAVLLFSLFIMQGLAVVHGVVHLRKAHVGWLIALYVLMMVMLPQLMAMLGLLGYADVWLKLRERVAAKQAGG